MNKPNLFLPEHSLAIHKINIMNCKYHLCIRIQFVIKHRYNGSGKLKMNTAIQFIYNKNSALFKCLNDITCNSRNLLCSCRIK